MNSYDQNKINDEILLNLVKDCQEIYDTTYIPVVGKTNLRNSFGSEFSQDDNGVDIDDNDDDGNHVRDLLNNENYNFHRWYGTLTDDIPKKSKKCICCKCSKKMKLFLGISTSILLATTISGVSISVLTKEKMSLNFKYDNYSNENNFNENNNFNLNTKKKLLTKTNYPKFSTKMVKDFNFSNLKKTTTFPRTFFVLFVTLSCMIILILVLFYIYRGFIRRHLISNKLLKTSQTQSEDMPEGKKKKTISFFLSFTV